MAEIDKSASKLNLDPAKHIPVYVKLRDKISSFHSYKHKGNHRHCTRGPDAPDVFSTHHHGSVFCLNADDTDNFPTYTTPGDFSSDPPHTVTSDPCPGALYKNVYDSTTLQCTYDLATLQSPEGLDILNKIHKSVGDSSIGSYDIDGKTVNIWDQLIFGRNIAGNPDNTQHWKDEWPGLCDASRNNLKLELWKQGQSCSAYLAARGSSMGQDECKKNPDDARCGCYNLLATGSDSDGNVDFFCQDPNNYYKPGCSGWRKWIEDKLGGVSYSNISGDDAMKKVWATVTNAEGFKNPWCSPYGSMRCAGGALSQAASQISNNTGDPGMDAHGWFIPLASESRGQSCDKLHISETICAQVNQVTKSQAAAIDQQNNCKAMEMHTRDVNYPCDDAIQCKVGLTCLSQKCVPKPKLDNGYVCTDDIDCKSNTCAMPTGSTTRKCHTTATKSGSNKGNLDDPGNPNSADPNWFLDDDDGSDSGNKKIIIIGAVIVILIILGLGAYLMMSSKGGGKHTSIHRNLKPK